MVVAPPPMGATMTAKMAGDIVTAANPRRHALSAGVEAAFIIRIVPPHGEQEPLRSGEDNRDMERIWIGTGTALVVSNG